MNDLAANQPDFHSRSWRSLRVSGIIGPLLALTLMFGMCSVAEATHFRYGHLSWRPRPDISSTTATFTLVDAFKRDDFRGSGFDGFPITGDVVLENVGGTALRFGDGTQTQELKYRVTAYSVTGNWIIGVALNPGTPGVWSGKTIAEAETNDGPLSANQIAIGDDFSGDIATTNFSQPNDVDWISFIAQGGESLTALLGPGGTLSSGLLNVTLYDRDGITPLLATRVGMFGGGAQITLPQTAGTYFFKLHASSFFGPPSSGSYTFQLRSLSIGAPNIDHTFPTLNNAGSTWTTQVATCCRTFLEQNNPGNGYGLITSVELNSGNRSPVSSLPPIVPCPVNAVCKFAVPAVDGDPNTKLRWRLATPGEANSFNNTGFVQPPGLQVDQNTGEVTWNTAGRVVGQYWSIQIVIEDRDATTNVLRTQVPVDFLILIVSNFGVTPRCNIVPNPVGGTTVTVGGSYLVTVFGTDQDVGDSITLNSAGLPPGSTTNPPLPAAFVTQGSTVFSWTPTLADVGLHPLLFTVTDRVGLQGQCLSVVNVPIPLKCDANGDGAIDTVDLSLISRARGKTALPGDPRDADSDGVITPADVKACIPRCTRPNCATR